MKKIIFILSIAVLVASCSFENKSEIGLFNGIVFKLNQDEQVVNISGDKRDIFYGYMDKIPVSVPLFRCVETDKYVLFLGIPVGTSIKEMIDSKFSQIRNSPVIEHDSLTYFYMKHQDDKNYVTEYVKSFDKNMVYVLAISKSITLSDSLFNRKTLDARFGK
jgi:hypothetical protein